MLRNRNPKLLKFIELRAAVVLCSAGKVWDYIQLILTQYSFYPM